MVGHFHFKGVHVSFGPQRRQPHHHHQDHHYGLYAAVLALLVLAALAWTRQPVPSFLPLPHP